MSSPADVPGYPVPSRRVRVAARRDARRSHHWGLLGLALLTAAAGIATISTSNVHGFIDLDVYRLGVRQWLNGGDLYGTLPPTSVGVRLPFIYPPFAVIALSPLALVSWSVARMLTFGVSVAALAVTIYLSTRRLWPAPGPQGALVVSGFALPLTLWLEPVRETIEFGQVNLVLMMLVAADCLLERTRWPRGLLVGIAAAIKLTPAVFLLYFLIRRDIRAAAVTVVSGALATAIGFAVLPRESMRYWFSGFAGAASLAGSPYATNQTVKAALVRLSLPRPVESGLWLLLAVTVLVLAVVGVWRAVSRSDAVLAMVIISAAGLLLSPISWSHHWVWIVPALLIMVTESVRTRSTHWIIATGVTMAVFYVGIPNFLPKRDGREFGWSLGEYLLGDSYVLLTLVLLIVWSVSAWQAAGRAARATPRSQSCFTRVQEAIRSSGSQARRMKCPTIGQRTRGG